MMHNKMDEERAKRQQNEREICQRFVRLSCDKMGSGRGTVNLRRNLLILRLLRSAREDMKQVPIECEALLQNNKWQPTQRPFNSFSPRRQSPSPRRAIRAVSRSMTPQRTFVQRRVSVQATPPVITPKVPRAYVVYSADSDEEEPVEKTKEASIGGEKENRTEEDVEELFLQKVGVSVSIPPPTPEEPRPLSDAFTGHIQAARVHVPLDDDSMPPLFFRAEDESIEKSPAEPQNEHVVPQQHPMVDFFSTSPLDEDEETDGETTEDDEDGDVPSFKRRHRKRKPLLAVGVRPMVVEKRVKDGAKAEADELGVNLDEQCVPIAI